MKSKTKKPLWTIKNSSCIPSNKINKYEHRVKIIGDNHLKGSAARINQFLNTRFEVCSFIKPSSSANQLVHSQETECMCLGRKDAIVINGGTNGSDKNSTKRSGILVMTQFMQKYNNTNAIVVNIPPRHDLGKECKTSLTIQTHNVKLSKTAKSFRHVTFVEMVSNRKYFTKHGLHFNSIVNELLVTLTATQIDELINNFNKIEPVIALHWKEEATIKSINVTDNHKPYLISTEDNLSKVLIPLTQFHNN